MGKPDLKERKLITWWTTWCTRYLFFILVDERLDETTVFCNNFDVCFSNARQSYNFRWNAKRPGYTKPSRMDVKGSPMPFLRNFILQAGQPHRGEKNQRLSPGVFLIGYWLVKNRGHYHGALTKLLGSEPRSWHPQQAGLGHPTSLGQWNRQVLVRNRERRFPRCGHTGTRIPSLLSGSWHEV